MEWTDMKEWPKETGRYLVRFVDVGYIGYATAYFDGNQFTFDPEHDHFEDCPMTHWMPLPDPHNILPSK